jgi:hypothetical protein
MAVIVVALDVIKMHRLGDPGPLVEFQHVVIQVGVIGQRLQVALEVAEVDRLKPDQGDKQTSDTWLPTR